MSKHISIARHKARELALQAIYQWQYGQGDISEIATQFSRNNDFSRVDEAYFIELLYQTLKHLVEVDSHLEKVVERPFHELTPVELAILRIAVYEFIYRQDVPFKVVINEAVQITKTFGAQDGFVNGVLNKLAQDLRSVEFSTHLERLAMKHKDEGCP
jgi:N utilization substance protein B